MKKKRMILATIFAVLALLGGIWLKSRYVLFRWQLLPRAAAVLDLREENLDRKDFEHLGEKLPDCAILWSVPLQGQRVSSEEESLRITSLPDEDLALMDCFPKLNMVDASGCEDYENLLRFAAAHPGVQLRYQVSFGDSIVENTAQTLTLTDPVAEELQQKLQWLPELKTLSLSGNLPEPEALMELRNTYPHKNIQWSISFDGKTFNSSDRILQLGDLPISPEEIREMIRWLPALETVDLTGTALTDEDVMALADDYKDCFFLWEMTFGQKKIPTDTVELDISGEIQESTGLIESRLPYFPNMEKVIMSHCGLDDETMDALNKRYEDIRFVWTVMIGDIEVRTDETYFYPIKNDRNAVVRSEDMYPLRYCTDMICIDVGHMWYVNECEWAAYMPNLRYLVIAYTSVSDLTPLSGLKNLAYLEIFHSRVTDYSPLIGCTGLEDINLSMTYGDYRPLLQMPWLKNVWWAGVAGTVTMPCSGAHIALPEALPDTQWRFYEKYAANRSGWRQLPNYYAMRDLMDMFYLR